MSDTVNDIRKKRKAALFKMAILLAFLAIIFIFASIAWFTMNKENAASGMGISVGDVPYELAVSGDNAGAVSYQKSGNTYISTLINNMNTAIKAVDGKSGTYTIDGGDTTLYSALGSDVIKWRMTDSSAPSSKGVGPDSSGEFTFYIIPHTDDALTVHFSLRLDGYSADVTENEDDSFYAEKLALITEGNSKYTAVQYFNRHMLFFKKGSKGSYQELIDPENFSIDFTDEQVTRGEPIQVDIRWIWPNTFAQMACIAESDNITNHTATINEIRAYMVDKPEFLLDTATISKTNALSKMASPSGEGEDITYTFDDNKATNTANLDDLSMGYNMADGIIGKDIAYFLLMITAE